MKRKLIYHGVSALVSAVVLAAALRTLCGM